MTIAQYKKKVEIARRCGSADIGDGGVLEYGGPGFGWSIVSVWRSEFGVVSQNVVQTSHDPMRLAYLCCD